MAQAAEFGERVAGGVAGAATGLTAEWLCETYALPVYRFASMLSRGDVEAADLAQDTLERAVRRLRTYDADRGSVDTWLWKLAVSAAADAGRIAGRRSRLLWRLQYFHARDDDVALDIAAHCPDCGSSDPGAGRSQRGGGIPASRGPAFHPVAGV
jgi:DNA-directed RNA polymerase specialized sigma24 family protein